MAYHSFPRGQRWYRFVLEPNNNLIAQTHQKGLFEKETPVTSFVDKNIHAEYQKLQTRSIKFTMQPTKVRSSNHRHLRRPLRQSHSDHGKKQIEPTHMMITKSLSITTRPCKKMNPPN